MVSSMVSTEALAERCRGTWKSLPSSIWARTGQMEPGMYLPSWPMNMIRAAGRAGSGEPSAASSTRHTCIAAASAASTATREPATGRKPRLARALRSWPHSVTTA